MNDTDRAEIDARTTAIVRRFAEAMRTWHEYAEGIEEDQTTGGDMVQSLNAALAALAPQPAAQATHEFVKGRGYIWMKGEPCAVAGCGQPYSAPCHSETAQAVGTVPMSLKSGAVSWRRDATTAQPASEAGRTDDCPHEAWETTGNSRRCADCREVLPGSSTEPCIVTAAKDMSADALQAGADSELQRMPNEAGRCGNCGHDHSAFARCTDCACVTWRKHEPGEAGRECICDNERHRGCPIHGDTTPPFVPDPGSSFADGGPEILDTLADIEKGVVADPRKSLPDIVTMAIYVEADRSADPMGADLGRVYLTEDVGHALSGRPLVWRTTAQAWKDAYEREQKSDDRFMVQRDRAIRERDEARTALAAAENGAAKEQMRAITAERALAAATAEVERLHANWKVKAEQDIHDRTLQAARIDERTAERDALAAELARIRGAQSVGCPRASDDEKDGGWRYPMKILKAVKALAVEDDGVGTLQLEVVDAVMHALETYGLVYALPLDSITRAEHEALRQRFENACGKITRLESEHEVALEVLNEENADLSRRVWDEATRFPSRAQHEAALAAAHEAGALAMREACVELLREREGTWAKKRVEFGDFKSAAKSYYARQNEAQQSADAVAALPAPARGGGE